MSTRRQGLRVAVLLALAPGCQPRHLPDGGDAQAPPVRVVTTPRTVQPTDASTRAPGTSGTSVGPAEDTRAHTSSPIPEGLARSLFLASWTTVFVRHVCSHEQYFRQCFRNVDDAACDRLMSSAANNCIQQNMAAIPDPIPPGGGPEVGRLLGTCAGTVYESTLAGEGQRTNSALCNDVQHWMH